MEEEFYAIIKLVSGEEIMSKVCPSQEEDKLLLILDNPVIIEKLTVKQWDTDFIKVIPWIKNSDEDMFIINFDSVITIIETNEIELIKIHQKYSKDKNKKSRKVEPTKKMGYISSIKEARKLLEKIYKS